MEGMWEEGYFLEQMLLHSFELVNVPKYFFLREREIKSIKMGRAKL